ncbi:MAG TPA: acetyl-CoA carboxylase biotin carboxyl carrier protein [Nitrospiria bacterium]|jgi:acetyl-CoA carboxylase biotin carboxyl carrier protein|nr:acetyl-CoA carboxylase biotin carboxyl carrier protein [Nitrospiria bacterium]
MNIKELKELIDLLKDTEVTELEIEKAGVKVRIKKGRTVLSGVADHVDGSAVASVEKKTAMPETPEVGEKPVDSGIITVTSPIVGTFYRSSSPDALSYVEIGDVVKKGQVLCIIEAMKLMNEIESEVDGKVVEILLENAQPVEYGEPLFRIEPLS